MKYLICKFALLVVVLLCGWTAVARPYGVEEIPNVQRTDRRRFTSNPDGVLSPAAVARIDSLCFALRDRGAAQVAVVAVEEIAGGDTFTFAHRLFSQWGVGNAERDNGLGILLVRGAREIRFVTGPGLEGVLPDALCKRIQMRYMLPSFREGDYDRGMVLGVEAVASVLAGSELDTGEADWNEESDGLFIWPFLLVIGVGMVVLLLGLLFENRCPRCKRLLGLRLVGRRTVIRGEGWHMEEQTFRCVKCGHEHRKQVRRVDENDLHGSGTGGVWLGGMGGLGGRRSGGFGGGSFGGGFGGGSFGGGGAGSKW